MSWVRTFLAFLWDFVVGDDPAIALAVVAALALAALVASGGVAAWWVVPVVVAAVLSWSVLRESRR